MAKSRGSRKTQAKRTAKGQKTITAKIDDAARDADITERLLQGTRQVDIAKEFGLTQARVSQIAARIHKDYTRTAYKNLERRLGGLLHESELIKKEAWNEWFKSKDRKRIKTQTKVVNGVTETVTIEETELGDRGYLETIGRQMQFEAALLGIAKGSFVPRNNAEDLPAKPPEGQTQGVIGPVNIQVNQINQMPVEALEALDRLKGLFKE